MKVNSEKEIKDDSVSADVKFKSRLKTVFRFMETDD